MVSRMLAPAPLFQNHAGEPSCALALLSSLLQIPKLDRNTFMRATDRIEKPNLGVDGEFPVFCAAQTNICAHFI